MLIIFGGLPGSGKTTIARALARQLGAVYVRIDSIEQVIRDSRTIGNLLDDLGYQIGYAVAEDNLRLGQTVVADSVNPLKLTRNAWTAVARRVTLRDSHPGGDAQIKALLASTKAFATSYDDMNFTPPYLAKIQARTLIVQGDRDPLYPVEISVEMAKAIPHSSLWILPDAGHGPVIGGRWPEFLKTAAAFLQTVEPKN